MLFCCVLFLVCLCPHRANSQALLVIDSKPVIGGSNWIGGHVNIQNPSDYRVSLFIKVPDLDWWTKPTFAMPYFPVKPDGTWGGAYATGGNDWSATDFCAFLIPLNYNPPPCGLGGVVGCPFLPLEIYQNALDSTCFHRYLLTPVSVTPVAPSICRGDTATLIASGGKHYLWSTGDTTDQIKVSPQYSSYYSVTVTDGLGGGARVNVMVQVNYFFTCFAHASPSVVCAGGKSVLSVSCSPPVEYLWDTGETTDTISVSPTESHTYFVIVTNDVGCKQIDSVRVIVSFSQLTLTADPPSLCAGQPTTLTASAASSYQWSNGFTTNHFTVVPSATTTYSVTATAAFHSCTLVRSIAVTVKPLPLVTVSAEPSVVCRGGSAIVAATSSDSIYFWDNGASTNTIHVVPATATTYSVTVTGANGCTAAAQTTVFVAKAAPANDSLCISFMPNPSNGLVTVAAAGTSQFDLLEVQILDQIGHILRHFSIEKATAKVLDLRDLPSGSYYLQVFANGRWSVFHLAIVR